MNIKIVAVFVVPYCVCVCINLIIITAADLNVSGAILQQSWSNKRKCALLTQNSTCSIHNHNPTGMRHSNRELKSMWQNETERLQKERQKTIRRKKRVAYERGNEGQTHKSGKRRPRVRWGRGEN